MRLDTYIFITEIYSYKLRAVYMMRNGRKLLSNGLFTETMCAVEFASVAPLWEWRIHDENGIICLSMDPHIDSNMSMDGQRVKRVKNVSSRSLTEAI